MENKYGIAAGGLNMIRIAKILAILAILTTVATTVTTGALINAALGDNGALGLGMAGLGGVLLIATGVLLLVSFIMEIVGLVKTTGAHAGYKAAVLMVVLNFVATGASNILQSQGSATLAVVLSVAATVLELLVVFLVISATVSLLKEKGDEATAANGVTLRTIYLVCTLITLATTLVNFFPALAGAALIALLVSGAAQIVAFFMYIGFLGRSVNALKA